jgi:DNA-binding transcriptional LysR family regulator
MQMESLQVFCDLARHRSFSRAGAVNGVTQSAVSQVVSQLEKRMGVQLVNRSTRPLQLTHAGQAYYEGCRQLLEQYAQLEASLRSVAAERTTTIQVAAIYSVGLSDMGQYVERFAQVCPHARVHIDYLHPDRVYECVADGVADLGLVSFPRKQRKFVCLPWRNEPMVLACAPRHPFASRRHIKPTEVEGLNYVGFDRNLAIRREVDRFWREHGVAPAVVMEFDSIENIKKAIEINAGIALLPEPTLRQEVATGSLVAVPLAGATLNRPLAIIHRRHQSLSPSTRSFVELLQSPLVPHEVERSGRGPARHPRSPGRRRTVVAPANGPHAALGSGGASS